MSSEGPILALADVGKAYFGFTRLAQRWAHTLTLGRRGAPSEQWVLRDISFAVRRGESIGIIGHNGAGKSTLLKLISGVTEPSAGRIDIGGRISAVLELGVGLHPDLTGRANIGLAGQLQGFTAAEMRAAENDVVAFAEIGTAIDQPVRTYSSGMLARLAFAIATAIRPDILIVDEVLSVGDSYFQHKSFARIREFQRQGTTILFVSHDITAMRTLCDRVLLLSGGRLLHQGPPDEVLDRYNAMVLELDRSAGTIEAARNKDRLTIPLEALPAEPPKARIVSVTLSDAAGQPVAKIETGATVTLDVEIAVDTHIPDLFVGFIVRDRLGNDVYGTNTLNLHERAGNLAAASGLSCRFSFAANFGPGSYSVSGALAGGEGGTIGEYFAWVDRMVVFDVVNTTRPPFTGVNSLLVKAEIRRHYAPDDLNAFGRKVFSQFGEDGILEEIFRRLGIEKGTCIEFGGYDGLTFSNTANLIRNHGWRGGFIELDKDLAAKIRDAYRGFPVETVEAEVLPDNIEDLLDRFGFPVDFDLLSIDIDGNDYWVWRAIERYRPKVVIVECNGAYPPHAPWIMPFDPTHRWRGNAHYGANPKALNDLARNKSYRLVSCEEDGANMVFVDDSLFESVIPHLSQPKDDDRFFRILRPPRYGLAQNNWTHPKTPNL
jgi:lipopolysaccharide transport system ATP-binding protein